MPAERVTQEADAEEAEPPARRRKALVNAVVIVNFDATWLCLPSPTELASDQAEKETTRGHRECEMIRHD
jgi:hypothetical protein